MSHLVRDPEREAGDEDRPGEAGGPNEAQDGHVASWESYSYLWGPGMAMLVVGVLALLLRWAFRRGGSLVARAPRPGPPSDYGLLVSVATPGSYVEAELLRSTLAAAGLKATVATTTDGPRLMVFAGDEQRARSLLAHR